MWAVFDFLTVTSGLAARVLVPGLDDPVAAYPALAELVLSPWLAAFFTLALLATVMSTLDSYLFLAAATVGHDLAPEAPGDDAERRRTRWGLALSASLAAAGALLFDSVVAVWHHVGSVVTSALLLPVVAIHLPTRWRYRPAAATAAMIGAAAVAVLWLTLADDGRYPFGIEPMFPALATSAAVWLVDRAVEHGTHRLQ
jgi:SSS family solute:Na+ symporter